MYDILIASALLAVGLVLLYYGADWLVDGASALAQSFGVRPFVIGLTVVAFGTSSPELVVSVVASVQGKSPLVLGNILGSNLSNVGLILGLSAIIVPLAITVSTLKAEVPALILVSLGFYGLAADGVIGRGDGAILLGVLAAGGYWYWRRARLERDVVHLAEEAARMQGGLTEQAPATDEKGGRTTAWSLFWVALGVVALVAGAEALVRGAVSLARRAGVGEEIIGFTLVALGTSLPELATSVVAAVRRETDMCVGNIVGSNIMNILAIGGVAATIRPVPVTSRQLMFDFPAVVGLSAILLPLMRTGWRLSRLEGLFLVLFYFAYMALLFTGHLGSIAPV